MTKKMSSTDFTYDAANAADATDGSPKDGTIQTSYLEQAEKDLNTAAKASPIDFAGMTGGALTPIFGGDEFADDIYLDDDGGGLPRLRLAQGLSPEVAEGTARPGEWVLEDHEPVKSVELLVTKRYAGRRRTAANSGGGGRADILCYAPKLEVTKPIELLPLHGIGDPGIECNECPFSQWTPRDDGSGRNNPPECLLIHTIEVASLTHGIKVEVQFKKTAERVLKEMFKAMKKHGGASRTLFSLTQERKQNAAGQPYFVPAFEVLEPTQEHLARWSEIQADL